MESKVNEKTEALMDNILTIAGAACLIYPLMRQATKSLTPELERLIDDKTDKKIPLIGESKEKHEHAESKNISDSESDNQKENEIAMLKRKLAELESEKEKSYNQ